ncbi:hypothetical protein BDZ45DRAFT_799021 [Acephala macrosclerotiorum]|nr:hypothetical protein BDZ45DRAFT_799021 [Acephala macrosclerotiorum]
MAHPRADDERIVRCRARSYSSLDDEEEFESRGKETVTPEVDPAELRRLRIERLGGSTSTRRRSTTQNMTSESHATLPSHKTSTTHRRRRRHHRDPEDKERRSQRKPTAKDEAADTYVYGAPTDRPKSSRITVKETRKLGRDGESSESEREHVVRERRERRPGEKEKKIKVIYVTREELKASRHKERRIDSDPDRKDSLERSSTHRSRRHSTVELPYTPDTPPKRSVSTRNLTSPAKPTLRRSNTTTSHLPPARGHAPTLSSSTKRSSFLGGFFAPAAPHHIEPEKLVECLTCLSDDIPRSKSAKLKCGHRMCHSCLKRIFKLSVKDPQHMPPKCCTADFIPLQHVDRLFDNNFKKLWNAKFAEYSTKNRIYCPVRKCGEWIRPANIHKEDGRKYGKCACCKTKVCCLCNGKWHGTKECPKDEETNKLLETAKQAGWQRCYSCRTMVELKEGCNHMTCRCTAEFCMICGLKWKTCNCPWFNYEAVEADRLNHMPVAEEAEDEEPRPRRLRRQRPNTYVEEITERQRQERLDERLARRLQGTTLADEDDDADDDYQGGIGEVHGIGNGAGHFMNQDYVRAAHNILTGNFGQATAAANYVMGVANARGVPAPRPNAGLRRMADRYPVPPRVERPLSPPPLLRRHSAREEAYNAAQTRPSERVVPRRTRTDYEAEAAVHAPLPRAPRPEPRPAVLAGLSETGRARNRVSAWRNHVEAGFVPEEGVLSV